MSNEQPTKKHPFQDIVPVGLCAITAVILGAVAVSVYAWLVVAAKSGIALELWALAITSAGGALGFLFGIPKVLQRRVDSNPPKGTGGQSSNGEARTNGADDPTYQQRVNTNLEEISDWLTKIIVGLGLVELRRIPDRIGHLASLIASSTTAFSETSVHGVALAIILYFGICGFLFGYLITRIYLQGALARADLAVMKDSQLNDHAEAIGWWNQLKAVQNTLATSAHVLDPQFISTVLGGSDESAQAVKTIWDSDPHKGKFGGKPEAGGRRLSAVLQPIAPGSPGCVVHFKVASSDPKKPLEGVVRFYLHPTFNPKIIDVPVTTSGHAVYDIVSMGAFTVGAEADNGETKLELDLAHVEGGTDAFYKS